jgi:hypothetical protein
MRAVINMNVVWERWFPVSSTFLGNYLFWQQHRESAKDAQNRIFELTGDRKARFGTLSFVIVVIAAFGSR